MKVCLVTPYFAPARRGVETHALQTCIRLRDKYGHDVFVAATRHGHGPVLIEASACQTPIIGTRIGGLPFAVLDNTTGLLVEPGDVNALAGAIDRILTDSELATSLGVNGHHRVKEHFMRSASVEATNNALLRAMYGGREELQQ